MQKSIKTEVIAGISTFLTMSYIIAVNPSILATEATGMSFSGVMSATILVSAVSSLLMGLYAKLPFALAPILIYVGLQMFKNGMRKVVQLEHADLFPALFIVFMIPFSFSITKGILWGFFLHVTFYILYTRTKELTSVSFVLAFISVLSLGGII